MSTADELPGVLACPRCDTPLEGKGTGHRCAACKIDFPALAGMPFLFAEPAQARAEWRNRADMALAKLDADAGQIDRILGEGETTGLARQRLASLAAAYREQRTRLAALLEPLLGGPTGTAQATYLALRTRLSPDQGLNTYYQNLHRDWCWGDEENHLAAGIIGGAMQSGPRRVLILGAGGGRLALDLHARAGAALTVAADFNPLLLLAAQRLYAGESLTLHEFPIAPRRMSDQAVRRELKAPAAAPAGLQPVLCDARRPPFRAGTFDVVVTPWLIDVLEMDIAQLAPQINYLLAEEGEWINFGSLAFAPHDPVRRYGFEEVMSVVQASGFAAPETREDEIPYMNSPASRQQRREVAVTFRAAKERAAPKPPRHVALPDWLVTGKDPVPLLEDFRLQAATTKIYAFVMSLIDGKRSIGEMAAELEKQRLMPRADAEAAIRGFLTTMYDDSRRGKFGK